MASPPFLQAGLTGLGLGICHLSAWLLICGCACACLFASILVWFVCISVSHLLNCLSDCYLFVFLSSCLTCVLFAFIHVRLSYILVCHALRDFEQSSACLSALHVYVCLNSCLYAWLLHICKSEVACFAYLSESLPPSLYAVAWLSV